MLTERVCHCGLRQTKRQCVFFMLYFQRAAAAAMGTSCFLEELLPAAAEGLDKKK